jgi:hypothetical protein
VERSGCAPGHRPRRSHRRLLPIVRTRVKELMSGYIELAREVGNIDRSHRRRLRRDVPALGFVCASVVVAGAEVVWVERAPSASYLSTPDRGAGQFVDLMKNHEEHHHSRGSSHCCCCGPSSCWCRSSRLTAIYVYRESEDQSAGGRVHAGVYPQVRDHRGVSRWERSSPDQGAGRGRQSKSPQVDREDYPFRHELEAFRQRAVGVISAHAHGFKSNE